MTEPMTAVGLGRLTIYRWATELHGADPDEINLMLDMVEAEARAAAEAQVAELRAALDEAARMRHAYGNTIAANSHSAEWDTCWHSICTKYRAILAAAKDTE